MIVFISLLGFIPFSFTYPVTIEKSTTDKISNLNKKNQNNRSYPSYCFFTHHLPNKQGRGSNTKRHSLPYPAKNT